MLAEFMVITVTTETKEEISTFSLVSGHDSSAFPTSLLPP